MKRILLALALNLVCMIGQAQTGPRATVRVGVWTLWKDQQINLSSHADAALSSCAQCSPHSFAKIVVHVHDNTLQWSDANGTEHTSAELFVTGNYQLAAHGATLTLVFPLRISVQHGALQLIATVPLERYVEMVVAAESGATDSAASRKALAVVVRSFALRSVHGHADFDLCDSTHCQWLHWRASSEAHQAALSTAGEILTRNDRLVDAFFHQNCGGHTASAEEVWKHQSSTGHVMRTESAGRMDPYCQRTGSSEWSATISRAQLMHALSLAGLAETGWKTLTVAKRGPSGRATMLLVGTTRISPEDFRLAVGRALGWNQIRSDWFEISAQGDSFLFHGRGAGHGVGLCQVGAAVMASEGHSYREILEQYFPASMIADTSSGAAWISLARHGYTLASSVAADAMYLPVLSQALAEAEARSGMRPHAAIEIRTYPSAAVFRNATLAPGWVAAFTEGNQIAVQSLRTLAARRLLKETMRHEFLHALVEAECNVRTPLWLREGLVEMWAGDAASQSKPTETPESINQKLAHARDETESARAHRAAAWYAHQLLQRYGREQVLVWLRTGVPADALLVLR